MQCELFQLFPLSDQKVETDQNMYVIVAVYNASYLRVVNIA